MNHEEFIEYTGLKFTYARVASRTDGEAFVGSESSHWKVTFELRGCEFSCEYSMGSAHKNEPLASDVLYGLQLDSHAKDFDCFEDWAAEYSHDPDSRAAERIYEACLAAATGMKAVLGESLYNGFMVLEEE